ncbi:MAG: glucose-6-phosphate isomerase [Pseudomonadota bacterium]
MTDPVQAAWDNVSARHRDLGDTTLRALFAADPGRFQALSMRACDLLVDISKQRINEAARAALIELARAAGVEARRDAMVSGAAINTTEGRSVRHMALRAPRDDDAFADVSADVHGVLDRFVGFAEAVRSGAKAAADGGAFTDVINIGIGGSDLGPVLATGALAPNHDGPRVHYVSNIDGAHFGDTVRGLNPARTLVIVASKSFTTLETMRNAQTARAWIADALGEAAVGSHFAAVSTNLEAVAAFGIAPDHVFGFWDWVGGRYSLWSSIGLPVAIALGSDDFRALLAGAHAMDQHFRSSPLEENLPVLMALIGIWNRNVEGHASLALIPYDQRLHRLAAYVQQLDMESNGKSVRLDGDPVTTSTAPVIWGEPGTNSQHAFFQMLHQGTDVVPVDFLIAAEAHEDGADYANHHQSLIANCLAQSEALMRGKTRDEAREELLAAGVDVETAARLSTHKTFPGNRPSTTIAYPKLTPHVLGQLLALYEHKVFVQGVVWGINSFDQWGVELGKVLAQEITAGMSGDASLGDRDSSTVGLLAALTGGGKA